MASVRQSNWINGAYAYATEAGIPVINPATETEIATIDSTPRETVNSIISSSLENFASGVWSHADASIRFSVLSKAANLLCARLPEFIQLETQQTGRPIREMKAQLSRIPEWLEYFASLARTHEGRVTPFKGPVINMLTRLPLGVVVQITPWNHPLLIATKKIAAALAAGEFGHCEAIGICSTIRAEDGQAFSRSRLTRRDSTDCFRLWTRDWEISLRVAFNRKDRSYGWSLEHMKKLR